MSLAERLRDYRIGRFTDEDVVRCAGLSARGLRELIKFRVVRTITAARVRMKTAASSAHAFDELISTTRTASMRGFGGSAPNRVGRSPVSTQRQNLRRR
jgi:hypothetical protein